MIPFLQGIPAWENRWRLGLFATVIFHRSQEASVNLTVMTLIAMMPCMIAATVSAEAKSLSVCSLQRDSQGLLGREVEVSGILREADGHYAFIQGGKCAFRFATGDDYQSFANTYPIDHDTQWELMEETLSKPVCSHINTRLVKGKFRGRVIRVPRTGTVPQNEMTVELVIQSASDIERVDVQCPVQD